MEFNQKINQIWERISDEDFLANKGVANEVRYYVFDYDPAYELLVREKIQDSERINHFLHRHSSAFPVRFPGLPRYTHTASQTGYFPLCRR